MKNVFPVKLIIPSRYTPPTYNWLSINNEKFYKESFFSFKDKEHLLKDTESFYSGTETGDSLAETGLQLAHSAL